MKKLSNHKIKELDIYEIIKNKDEKKLKELVINILEGIVKGYEDKNQVSYFQDFLVTIPLELGWKNNYEVQDKLLDKALSIISNFEGDTKEEAIRKSRSLLKELK